MKKKRKSPLVFTYHILISTGISDVTYEKVNPGQRSNFTCTVQGVPTPEEDSVDLYHLSGSELVTDGITRESSFTTDSERHVLFSVDNITKGSIYYCYIENLSYLNVTTDTYGGFSLYN